MGVVTGEPRTATVRAIDAKDEVDPYIQMIGGEFKGHGSQQKAVMKVTGGTFEFGTRWQKIAPMLTASAKGLSLEPFYVHRSPALDGRKRLRAVLTSSTM